MKYRMAAASGQLKHHALQTAERHWKHLLGLISKSWLNTDKGT